MQTINPRIDVAEFPYNPANPFAHMGRAVCHGLGSREWNRFLASLEPRERQEAIRSVKAIRIYEKPSCYWPRESGYKRGTSS